MKLYSSKLDYKIWYLHNIIPKNEYYGVKYGIKLTSLRWIQENQLENFAKVLQVFKKDGIYYVIKKDTQLWITCLYGIQKRYVDAYAQVFSFPEPSGVFLWYPKCCILKNEGTGSENPKIAFQKTNHKLHLDYRVNSLFHYGWRWPVNEIYDAGKNDSEIITEAFSFIHHQPHSYECEKSLEYWKQLEVIIKQEDTDYYNLILKKVQKIYIYYDSRNWIALENDFSWIQPINIFEWILHDESFIKFFEEVKYIDLKNNLSSNYFDTLKNEIQVPHKDDILILNFKTERSI